MPKQPVEKNPGLVVRIADSQLLVELLDRRLGVKFCRQTVGGQERQWKTELGAEHIKRAELATRRIGSVGRIRLQSIIRVIKILVKAAGIVCEAGQRHDIPVSAEILIELQRPAQGFDIGAPIRPSAGIWIAADIDQPALISIAFADVAGQRIDSRRWRRARRGWWPQTLQQRAAILWSGCATNRIDRTQQHRRALGISFLAIRKPRKRFKTGFTLVAQCKRAALGAGGIQIAPGHWIAIIAIGFIIGKIGSRRKTASDRAANSSFQLISAKACTER